MILRVPRLPTRSTLLITNSTPCQPQRPHLPNQPPHLHRNLHARMPIPPIPSPTPFVPDVATFLTLIGRSLSTHASKIPSWRALFTLTSSQLRELGVEPARTRRYLLRWRDKFRHGEFGVGGDLERVKGGKGVVRLCEVPAEQVPDGLKRGREEGTGPVATLNRSAGVRKVVLNVDFDPEGLEAAKAEGAEGMESAGMGALAALPATLPAEELKRARHILGVKRRGARAIYGSYVEPIKGTGGSAAVIRVQEGMWEHTRGHKVDGGERRKAEVRAKRRAAERKAQRA